MYQLHLEHLDVLVLLYYLLHLVFLDYLVLLLHLEHLVLLGLLDYLVLLLHLEHLLHLVFLVHPELLGLVFLYTITLAEEGAASGLMRPVLFTPCCSHQIDISRPLLLRREFPHGCIVRHVYVIRLILVF